MTSQTTPLDLTTRNATLESLALLLKVQHARKIDVVASAENVGAFNGQLVLRDVDRVTVTEPTIDENGVTPAETIDVNGPYTPTDVCDEGLAAKFDIRRGYLRRCRDRAVNLYDGNVNGWLNHADYAGRKYLLRAFRGDNGAGIARAFLSDGYKPIDNLDVLMAALDGVRQAGVAVDIDGCDLTERRMHVRVVCPQIAAMAPALLAGYRDPFADPSGPQRANPQGRDFAAQLDRWRAMAAREGLGYEPGAEPVVFAGFDISNSETGGGAFTLTPRLVVQVCRNGLTVTADALRSVHLGAKLDAGIIRYSDDTQRKSIDLVTAKTRDAVQHFLNPAYVAAKVAEIDAKAGRPVTDAPKTIEVVGKALAFTESEQSSILDHFIRGGQMTAGGLLNAVTSTAQTLPDPDAAAAMEGSALRVLDLVPAS